MAPHTRRDRSFAPSLRAAGGALVQAPKDTIVSTASPAATALFLTSPGPLVLGRNVLPGCCMHMTVPPSAPLSSWSTVRLLEVSERFTFMKSSLSKKPSFDHPMITFVLIALTCSILAAFGTKSFLDSRQSSDPCAEAIGKLRLEMGQSKVPSVFDERAWADLNDKYNQVFDSCDVPTANKFVADEFDPWAAPALSVFRRPTTEEQPVQDGSTEPTSTTAPSTSK
jgi:hypothetical protein